MCVKFESFVLNDQYLQQIVLILKQSICALKNTIFYKYLYSNCLFLNIFRELRDQIKMLILLSFFILLYVFQLCFRNVQNFQFQVNENGTADNEDIFYFNIGAAMKGIDHDNERLMQRVRYHVV